MDSPILLLIGAIPCYHTLTVNGILKRWVVGSATNGPSPKTEWKKYFSLSFLSNRFLILTEDKHGKTSERECSLFQIQGQRHWKFDTLRRFSRMNNEMYTYY
jgi:hypothetical protein